MNYSTLTVFPCCCEGSSTTVSFCWGGAVWDGGACLLFLREGVSEWPPGAPSRARRESELKQAALEKQQHSVIQPLACAPEHCVYICNRTYPLGSQRHPPPPSAPLPPLSPPCSLCLSFALSPRVYTLPLPLARLLSSSRHSLFLSHKDIVKQIHPRSFSRRHPYTNTPRALKIHPCVKITLS